MMTEPDPFGSAIEDYQRGLRGFPCIIERDDGFLTQEDIEPYFGDADDWAIEELEALGGLVSPVLDVGCGPGRHLIPLQDQRMVVGLDTSRSVLRVCRERGGRNLVLGRSTRLPFKRARFGSVLMMSNGLGLSGGLRATLAALSDIRRVLSSGGRLVAHTSDPTDPETGIHDDYRFRNIEQGRDSGLVRVRMVYREAVGSWFELMLMTQRQAVSILGLAGFEPVKRVPWGSSDIYISVPGARLRGGPRHLFRQVAGLLRGRTRRSNLG